MVEVLVLQDASPRKLYYGQTVQVNSYSHIYRHLQSEAGLETAAVLETALALGKLGVTGRRHQEASEKVAEAEEHRVVRFRRCSGDLK